MAIDYNILQLKNKYVIIILKQGNILTIVYTKWQKVRTTTYA